MNLRKQVEPLWKSRASGFLAQRHAHHAASRLTLMKRWLKRAFRHHEQSRELKNSGWILVLTGAKCKSAGARVCGMRGALAVRRAG